MPRGGYLLVFSNPTEGEDDAFNDWYDSIHVPDVLAVDGVVSARRFEIDAIETPDVDGLPAPPPPTHRYLAMYELDRDGNEVMTEFVTRVTSGQMALSETLDLATVGLSVWRPRGPAPSVRD